MSAIAEPPTPTPPRRQRQRTRTSHGKELSGIAQNNVGGNVHAAHSKGAHNDTLAQQNSIVGTSDNLVSPLTPPRPATEPAKSSMESKTSPQLAKQKHGRGRRRTNAKLEGNPIGASSSTARAARSSVDQPQITTTPLKQATQMYAGPTFHASPAPSSLPIPKFFAKPAALDDKPTDSNPTSTDDSSSQDSVSGHEDDSPTSRNSLLAQSVQPREPSPLDIFFKADREEKARLNQTSPLAAVRVVERAKSASPSTESFSQEQSRQHTRRQTTSMFPVERGSGTDDMKAKTEALKQLLLVPRAQHSSPALASHHSPSLDHSNLPNNGRTSSSSSTPSRLFPASKNPTRSEASLLDSPNVRLQSGRTSQAQRPLPYHIRQEYLNNLPIDQHETSSKSRYVTPVHP